MQNLVARSYLFVPANRPERFDKAYGSGADAVIVDLEDAVVPAQKIAARAAIAKWLSPAKPVLVRINSAGTEWFRDDADMCRLPGVAGVVLPKAERVEDLEFLAGRLEAAVALLPLIESAQGFWNAHAIAQARHVRRLIFGSIDFQLDLGIKGDDSELLYFRSQLVLVSRVAGIASPVDGVTVTLENVEQLRAETARARRLGFGGKLCIHPKQVGHVNEVFQPTPEEIAWARRIVEAALRADGAAIAVDGSMVDRPVMLKAEEILRESERGANPDAGSR